MNSVPFNEEKAISSVLYVINKLGGKIDVYRLAKILYFADQKHLVNYGRTIIGDEYVPMKYGPVPSIVYNAVKDSVNPETKYKLFSTHLSLCGKDISSDKTPDTDELSQSDIECLDASLNENGALDFDALYKKSHALAWNNAIKNNLPRLRVEDIAKEGGAHDDFIAYIKDCINDHYLALA